MCVCVNTYNAWFEGRFDFPLFQQVPVYLLEEGMVFNGVLKALSHHTAQTLVGAFRHELQERGRNRDRVEERERE